MGSQASGPREGWAASPGPPPLPVNYLHPRPGFRLHSQKTETKLGSIGMLSSLTEEERFLESTKWLFRERRKESFSRRKRAFLVFGNV